MKKEDLRIVFMGTPEFAKKSLEELVINKYNVVGVFCQPDKPSGRGMKLTKPPVKVFAEENNIPVYQPEKIKNNEEVLDILNKLSPNLIVVVAYGKILPKAILYIPKYGCINVHGSLLPKYRGAAPIQWAIINGDDYTGITTMYMDEGMDTGDMIHKTELPIEKDDTYGTVHDKMAILGAVTLKRTLDKLLEDGKLPRQKQEGEYTVAPMLDKEIMKMDFKKTGKEIVNLVRGLNPIPTAWCKIDDDKLYKVYGAEYVTEEELEQIDDVDISNYYEIGQIVYLNDKKNILAVRCKDGYVNLYDIKPKNSKRMLVGEYLRGSKIKVRRDFYLMKVKILHIRTIEKYAKYGIILVNRYKPNNNLKGGYIMKNVRLEEKTAMYIDGVRVTDYIYDDGIITYGKVYLQKGHTLTILDEKTGDELCKIDDFIQCKPILDNDSCVIIQNYTGWGTYSFTGERIIDPKYARIEARNGYFIVEKNQWPSAYNLKGVYAQNQKTPLIPVAFKDVRLQKRGIVVTSLPGPEAGKGVYSYEGKKLVPPCYKTVDLREKDILVTTFDDKVGLYSYDGIEIVPPLYNYVTTFGSIIVAQKYYHTRKSRDFGVYLNNGKRILAPVYDWYEVKKNKIIMHKGYLQSVYDIKTGKRVLPLKFTNIVFYYSLIFACQNGKWGIYDLDGKCLQEPIYSSVKEAIKLSQD